jgi:glycosyltransferase involved in cell wall biosynthesis
LRERGELTRPGSDKGYVAELTPTKTNLREGALGAPVMAQADAEYVDSDRLIKDPLVSVVMLTYNHERYLAEAIDGVVRQETSFPVELLIGEDCSTDGTRNVALSYQKRFPEMIRVIASEQNVGMHENLARLVAAARGKYIAFCEGDDFWHRSDKLSLQVAALEADPTVSLVWSDHRMVSDAGCVLREHDQHSWIGDWVSYDDLIVRGNVISTPTVCARSDLVKKAYFESPQCRDFSLPMGDMPLWLEISQCGRIRYLRQPLASYRLSTNSASREG